MTDAADAKGNARWQFERGWQSLSVQDWPTAVDAFTQVTQLAPAVEAGHFNLGNALFESQQYAAAAAAYQRAYDLEPSPGTLNNLGNACAAAGDLPRAIVCYRQALDDLTDHGINSPRPNSEDAVAANLDQADSLVGNLGRALESLGNWAEAAAVYRHAFENAPRHEQAIQRFARSSVWEADETAIQQALEAIQGLEQPQADTHVLAAACHHHLGQYAAELRNLVQANTIQPDDADILSRLASTQLFRGRHTEAFLCLHRALTLTRPTPQLHSRWLMASLYQQQSSLASLHEEARKWHTIHATSLRTNARPQSSRRTESPTPLKLGIVLSDDVSAFTLQCLSAFASHVHKQVIQVVGYCDALRSNSSLQALNESCQAWRHTRHLSDSQLVNQIQSDQVDWLIDAAGHGAHTRLMVFAQRAAANQLLWSGCWGTSGVANMDYILSDKTLIDPLHEQAYTEQICRLESAVCYRPPGTVPSVAPIAQSSDKAILGSACAPMQLTAVLLNHWCEVLASLPQYHFQLADAAYADESICQEVTERFHQAGLERDRLKLVATVSRIEAFEFFQGVDLVVDPYPVCSPLAACD
ncbi:MAG: tetratricopeptide repeat protein, partial [Pirellulaceae bacterium]|nr:tetratricopeptide repeat protein [Pirellulaceae bacterium]